MKFAVKLMIVPMFLAPILVAQPSAAAQKKPQPASIERVTPPDPGTSPGPNDGEALETPNQRRRRQAGESAAGVPSPKEYPLNEAVEMLQRGSPKTPAQRLPSTPMQQTGAKKSEPAKEPRPVTPPVTATEAVRMSDRWQQARDIPAEGKDGRVVFSDGAGLPTLVCAPLRLCIVELQSGERLTGEPQIGDSVRWNIEPASYGAGAMTTPMIVIKPKAVGLDTNLVITTDRRSYYLRLISSEKDYVAKVSFDYPDDARLKWSTALGKQAQDAREAEDKGGKTLVDSLESLHEDYRMTGDTSIRPIRVLDDGVHTYIQMNPAILHREAPVLAIVGPDGKAEMVNYRVKGSVYVVDRLFDRAQLILGSGRKARKADITRLGKDARLATRDPLPDPAPGSSNNEVKPQ